MNFKPNAWTLLFAIALGAFLYNMYGSKTTTETPLGTDIVEVCPPLEIPATEFYPDWSRYLTYAAFVDSLMEFGATQCPSFASSFARYDHLVNPNIRSFHLPRCELDSMLRVNPDGDYYAYLVMKNPKKDSLVIDLVFNHQFIPGTLEFEKLDKTLAAKGGESGGSDAFFDFTQPCPDSCNEGK